MMKILVAIGLVVLVGAGLMVFLYQNSEPSPSQIVETYIACGCGGCGGDKNTIEYLYESDDGKETIDSIRLQDKKAASSPDCVLMGCSRCTEYRLVAE